MPNPKAKEKSRKSEPAPRGGGRELVLGIDLGATKVVSALVDPSGAIVQRSERRRHENDGPGHVLEVVVQSARESLAGLSSLPARAGIAVAAQVDPDRGTVVYSPNLGWRDQPLTAPLSRELGMRVSAVNDARAATLAEWRFGAGRGESNFFCLVLGTGVGGSAVAGGVLLEGGTHAVGEVGHLTIVAGGRRCHCPNTGCFEAYVGGWGIAERARIAVASYPPERGTLLRSGDAGTTITAETVFRAARAGDALAGHLVDETEGYLEDGVVSVVNAFNPSLLVLAGGLLSGRPEWVDLVARAVIGRCQPAAARVRVTAGKLGEDAGVIGAATWARERAAPGRPAPPEGTAGR